jgi:hypothetical protein
MRSTGPYALALVGALSLAVASPAAALTKDAGVIAGFNFSTLRISGQTAPDWRATFAAGGVLDLGLNDRLGIRIEPMYLATGAQATHHNAYWDTMDGAVFHLDYIGVPILARYSLGTSERIPYLLGGIGLNFAIKREAELTQGQQRATVDFASVFSPVDVTLDLGGGLSFPAARNQVTLDGRASFGLMNVNQGGTVTFQGAPLAVPSTSTHSIAARVFVSYLFKL